MTTVYTETLARMAVEDAKRVMARRASAQEFKRIDYTFACEQDKWSARWEDHVIRLANMVIAASAK